MKILNHTSPFAVDTGFLKHVDAKSILLHEVQRRRTQLKLDREREAMLKSKNRWVEDPSTDLYISRIAFPKKSKAGSL